MKAIELSEKLALGVSSIYRLTGTDGYLRSSVVGQLMAIVPEDQREWNYLRLEGDCKVDDILSAAETMALGAEYRIVEVRDVVRTLNEKEKQAMLAYAQSPNDVCVLILNGCGNTFDAIASYCVTVDCNRMERGDLIEYLADVLRREGYRIERKALSDLTDACAADTGKCVQELHKLMLYRADTKEIRATDVAELTPPDTETKVFELTNAMQRGQFDRAIEVLQLLLDRGEKPAYLLATVTASYRRMFHIATSNAQDKTLARVLGMSEGALAVNRKIVQSARKTIPGYILKLKQTVDSLYELELGFKGGQYTPEVALEMAIARIMAVTKGA